MSEVDELAVKFEKTLGFKETKVKEILKNTKVSGSLDEILAEAGVDEAHPVEDASVATLLHSLAQLSKDADEQLKKGRKSLSDLIANSGGQIKTNVQLNGGWDYIVRVVKDGKSVDREELEKESGVGIVVTDDQIKESVAKYIKEHEAELVEKRYKLAPTVIVGVKQLPELKWANPAAFKPIIDEQILALLGPKDERDVVKKEKKKKADTKPGAAGTGSDAKSDSGAGAGAGAGSARSMFTEGFLGSLHKPGENAQIYPERMKEHLKFTGGHVMTRFPPEPNGYLHIGHSKAIAINFGFAQYYNGKCYLRFDDTNPEAEEEQYFTSIKEIVEWLGFKPWAITYSSDYFDQLYELAEQLILKDLAYVCFCTAEEMKAHRGISEDGTRGGKRTPCKHRSQSTEENLKLFREMRDGKYAKGEATLRMKQDLENPNPQMWDLVAYRVLNATHHRTGDKWKIYPTYDFTHCLVDSIENISHSLCTLEFYLSRESYDWLCNALCVYRPQQRESGRLNVTGTIMSKRKILKLVNDKIVRGWDDPRLFTLVAIRRRGVPPGAVLSFIAELGVTTTNSTIQASRFENSVRKYLEDSTPRLMMIPDPVPVILDNLPEDHLEFVSVPFKPGNPDFGEHTVPFTRTVYVDRSDFREEASKDYFRLAPGQSVGLLKVPHNIRVTSFKKDDNGLVTEIHAHYENDIPFKKPKTFIQWVAHAPAHNSPVRIAETRLFNQLFKSENPDSNPDGYLADINPDSEIILRNSIIETGFFEVKERSPWTITKPGEEKDILAGHDKKGAPEAVRFQALRVGYFCLDKDSTPDSIVLNRIVTLKEDTAKNN
ncbi:glutamine--tRNA ligase [Sugiyamaella lignohabitans]|uniref:glutamine--tRNA ligase n=1 Tax=Sugiyamaella lignohabitans TaxID=796027 RepID=A0A167CRW5_9ASCO|nr:glutamine--tRNA ligase [Sugiyamaella lignohabitans]ANB12035.1 glutamine--tRNA ligase [Sugiyamaella lignohabitans]